MVQVLRPLVVLNPGNAGGKLHQVAVEVDLGILSQFHAEVERGPGEEAADRLKSADHPDTNQNGDDTAADDSVSNQLQANGAQWLCNHRSDRRGHRAKRSSRVRAHGQHQHQLQRPQESWHCRSRQVTGSAAATNLAACSVYICAYRPPSSSSSSACEPDSTTWPPSITTMRSARRTVENRCEMTIVVTPRVSSRKRWYTSASPRTSSDAVGSSRMRMPAPAFTANSARASARRCHSPPESWLPWLNSRVSGVAQPSGNRRTRSIAPACSAAWSIVSRSSAACSAPKATLSYAE